MSFYKTSIQSLPSFIYPSWAGEGTIKSLGDIADYRYFYVDNNVPLPTSNTDAFQAVAMSDDIARQLIEQSPLSAHLLAGYIVPPSVASWQLKRALTQMGLRQAVETAVAAGTQDLKDMWTDGAEYHRDHAMVTEIATAIGKTSADIDALFVLAGGIV